MEAEEREEVGDFFGGEIVLEEIEGDDGGEVLEVGGGGVADELGQAGDGVAFPDVEA